MKFNRNVVKKSSVLSKHAFLDKIRFTLKRNGICNTLLQYVIDFVRILFIKRVLLIRYIEPDDVQK